MKTTLDCLPCYLKQTLQVARLATPNLSAQRDILDTIARLLPQLDLDVSPPENAILVYDTIANLSGDKDPFASLKQTSNRLGKSLQHQVRQIIAASDDPLYTACLYSVAGNIIDYGSLHEFNPEEVIHSCRQRQFSVNDYALFRAKLNHATSLLYLGDNSGEIVFDALVVEQLKKQFPKLNITFVVKQRPIINDALMEDALECGLPDLCTVIDNGTGCPGSPLNQCSKEFRAYFNNADLIISKGQGNFETLSEQKGLYFLLICKCAIVGHHLQELSGSDIELGDFIFFKG